MDDINEIIMNRLNDGKYTENDILNLAVKIYGLIKENPSASFLVIRLHRGDAAIKYGEYINTLLMHAGNPVETIKYIIEELVEKLDGLDNIYLYKPVRFADTFDVDFNALRVLIEWSCYDGKEEEDDGRTHYI